MASSYWKWKKAIPPKICNALLEDLTDKSFIKSLIGEKKREEGIRNNHIHFLSTNHWFEGILYNHVRYANQSAKWEYDINNIENIQISKYDENEYYDWHRDSFLVIPDFRIHRKLSIVVQLNDPSEYEGGGLELEFDDTPTDPKIINVLSNQGDIVVFPSVIKHRAVEVTKGTRYSATGWVSGPNFK